MWRLSPRFPVGFLAVDTMRLAQQLRAAIAHQ
jgi:hypothetical protein